MPQVPQADRIEIVVRPEIHGLEDAVKASSRRGAPGKREGCRTAGRNVVTIVTGIRWIGAFVMIGTSDKFPLHPIARTVSGAQGREARDLADIPQFFS